MGNHNTAQQQGESVNPFKGISSMYNAHLQHKDRVASLKQREEHFKTNSQLKAASMLQKESHFQQRQELNQQQFNAKQDIAKQKLDLAANKHNLDINKHNHKVEKDANDFKQRQKEWEDKMGVERAKVEIASRNSHTFEKDAAGKNITRNVHNQILANQYNDGKKKKDQVKFDKAPIPTIHKTGPKITKGRNFTPSWKQGKVKAYKLPSGRNIKGRHGNRKKGL